MITLFDRNGRAIIRLYGDWFVAYTEAKHLGWLYGTIVYDKHGRHIGRFKNGKLLDRQGYIVASDSGSVYPGMAGIPGKPGRPGFSGDSGDPGYSGSWSSMGFKEFFGV